MALSKEEMHYLGMEFIGEELQQMGYEFLGVNSAPKKHPQFVIFKSGEKIKFVIVRTKCVTNPKPEKPEYVERVIDHATKQESGVWYAYVLLAHGDDTSQAPIKGERYSIIFQGFEELLP
ncbi:MAG: Na(+)-translocating NADH-quinone reductase subunit F [Weeksellaceae bacterium]|nr:Na(+)-translocating NADH-quinone reductase subunit F [Weeksellaceae bacterium]